MTGVYFDPAVGGDGSTVTDDANAATGLANGGHRSRFVGALAQIVAVAKFIVDKVSAASQYAADALAYKNAAGTYSEQASSSAIDAYQAAASAASAAGSASASAVTAGQKADQAAAAASSVNLPVLSAQNAYGILQANAAGSGYQITEFASQAEAEAGVDAYKPMSALRVAQAIGAITGKMVRSTRTANTILSASDRGRFIDVTSGTFTQTFTSAATLGAGWYCIYRNSGSGDVTLDPNASETIDGVTSFIVYPSEVRLISCDGASFSSVVLTPFYKVFTASGLFYKPPGYSAFGGELIGAGGGGAGGVATYTNSSSGGGGGACFPFVFKSSLISSVESVVIGSGGTGGSAGVNGGQGGNSSFAGMTGYGGGGGGYANGARPGSGGGWVSSGQMIQMTSGGGAGGYPSDVPASVTDVNNKYGIGGGGAYLSGGSVASGSSIYGGGCGGCGSWSNSVVSTGGASIFGGGGGGAGGCSANSNSYGGSSRYAGTGGQGGTYGAPAGYAGTAPGGGGGAGGCGVSVGGAGGAGARGEFRIWGVV